MRSYLNSAMVHTMMDSSVVTASQDRVLPIPRELRMLEYCRIYYPALLSSVSSTTRFLLLPKTAFRCLELISFSYDGGIIQLIGLSAFYTHIDTAVCR